MPTLLSSPAGDFVTTTLIGALTSGSTSATVGAGLALPATNGILQLDYDSLNALGTSSSPETVLFAAYNSGTGALTGLIRGLAGTTGVAHSSTATVQSGPSSLYFSATDLNKIIAQSAWTAWTPSYGANGSMTYTTVTTTLARYQQIGKTVSFQLEATGTTGGSANTAVTFTVPVAALNGFGCFAAAVFDSTDVAATAVFRSSTTVVGLIKADASNWGIGSGRVIRCSGSYESA